MKWASEELYTKFNAYLLEEKWGKINMTNISKAGASEDSVKKMQLD